MEFSRISNSVTSLGEGISINRNKGRLNWVDISEGKVFCNSLVTGKTEINIDFVLPSCTFQDGKNGVYISHVGGISKIDFEHRTKENCVSWFDIDCGLRCNDGTIDLNGNIWISTMSISHEKNMGKIWFWNLKDKPKLIIDNLTIPNSIAFDSKRKRLYFADSSKNTIYYGK
jgi:sugar lactone lactonase YvrE